MNLEGSNMHSVSPYRDGFSAYLEAGWTGVIPVKGKSHPIKGYTGRQGSQASAEDSRSFAVSCPSHNIAIRMPKGVCGIDVDDYGVKEGCAQLAQWTKTCGPLPPAPYSTSRGADSPSRIIWFRYESDNPLTSSLSSDVEVILSCHRYAVVWPSVHPDTGQTYQWYSAEGEALSGPPRPDELPLLPERWTTELSNRRVATNQVPGDGLSYGEVLSSYDYENSPSSLAQLLDQIVAVRAVKSHHDTMLWAVCEAVRRCVVGDFPAQEAWDALKGVWDDWEHELTESKADRPVGHEYESFWAYACAQVNVDYEKARRASRGRIESGECELVWKEDKPELISLLHLPESFWLSRPVFQHVRQAAHARSDSADPAFFGLLARLSSMLPVGTKVDTGLLSPLSLNTFVALLDDTGGGKSSGAKMPGALLPVPSWLEGDAYRENVPLGSGEGVAELFYGTAKEDTGEVKANGDPVYATVRRIVRHNALFYVDEGQSIARLQDRNGSTLGETIRRAGNGETLGQTNAHADRTRFVPEGKYCMGMVVGFQPTAAAELFAEGGLGTPQRFLWVSTSDMALADEDYEPEWPGELPVDPFKAFQDAGSPDAFVAFSGPAEGVVLSVDPAITKELKRHIRQKKSKQITVPEIESHKPRTKAKVAALLAILDERLHVSLDDWALAEVVWAVSLNTQKVAMSMQRRRADEAAEKESQRAADQAARNEMAKVSALEERSGRSLESIARTLVRYVQDPSKDTRTVSYLTRHLKSTHRAGGLGVQAFEYAVDQGWLRVDADGKSGVGLGSTTPE